MLNAKLIQLHLQILMIYLKKEKLEKKQELSELILFLKQKKELYYIQLQIIILLIF